MQLNLQKLFEYLKNKKRLVPLLSLLLILVSVLINTAFVTSQKLNVSKKAASENNKKTLVAEKADQIKKGIGPDFVPGEIIVKFKTKPAVTSLEGKYQTNFSTVNSILKDFPVLEIRRVFVGEVKQNQEFDRIYKIKLSGQKAAALRPKEKDSLYVVSDPSDLSKLIERLKEDTNVLYAEPNIIYSMMFVPNDSLYDRQWALPKISAPEGWDILRSSFSGTTVAVIDTGIDTAHEDLPGQIWQNKNEIPGNGIDDDNNGYIDDTFGWDFLNLSDVSSCAVGEDCSTEDNDPADKFGHGTHVAGIIAAKSNNNLGIAGVCPNCQVMNLRAGWKASDGNGWVTIEGAARAIVYAADNGASIINMSFGGQIESDLLRDSISYAYDKNVLSVASAGNDGSEVFSYPAASQHVISVASTDSSDGRSWFSNYGSWIDIAAPGSDILSLRAAGTDIYGDGSHIVNEKYYLCSGTSMAAPMVAGVLGALKSLQPNWTAENIGKYIKLMSDQPRDSGEYYGDGRINLYKALTTNIPLSEAQLYNPHEKWYYSLPKDQEIQVKARAKGSRYLLEYGESYYPTAWTEIARKDTPVDVGYTDILTTWMPSQSEEKLYTIRLSVFDENGRVNISSSWVRFWDPTLGWEMPVSSQYSSGPVVGDLDGDGKKEIFVTSAKEVFTNDLNLYGYKADGSPYFSRDYLPLEGGRGFSATPAIGDIDGDGQNELVVVGENVIEYPFRSEGVIFVIKKDGTFLPGWNPKRISDGISIESRWCPGWEHDRSCGGFPSSPALADINKDGKKDIVLLSRFGKLYVFDYLGNSLPGFPKLLGEGYWFGNTFNTPAIGDVNNDGDLEIAVTLGENNKPEGGSYAYLLTGKGEVLSGWPKKVVGEDKKYYYYSSFFVPPVIGDIDGDGISEIFISSWNSGTGKIFAYKPDGSSLPNWPVSAPWCNRSSLSMGKIGNITNPAIFTAAVPFYGQSGWNNYYAFSVSGSSLPNWPKANGPDSFADPVLSDFNNDQKQEVLFLSSNSDTSNVYTESGTILPTWPRYMRQSSFRTPVVDDIDNDGKTEIVLMGTQGILAVRKLADIPYSFSEWNQFHQNKEHTGFYGILPTVTPTIVTTPSPTLMPRTPCSPTKPSCKPGYVCKCNARGPDESSKGGCFCEKTNLKTSDFNF